MYKYTHFYVYTNNLNIMTTLYVIELNNNTEAFEKKKKKNIQKL